MNSVASVTMKAATRSRTMKKALTSPNNSSDRHHGRNRQDRRRRRQDISPEQRHRQIHDGTDRQVDASNQQDEGHADGDDCDMGRLDQDVGEVAGRQEPVGQRAEHGQHDDEQSYRRVPQQQQGEGGRVLISRHLFTTAGVRRLMAAPSIASLSNSPRSILRLDLAVAHHQDAVAHADQLLDLGGDHQDAGAARGQRSMIL